MLLRKLSFRASLPAHNSDELAGAREGAGRQPARRREEMLPLAIHASNDAGRSIHRDGATQLLSLLAAGIRQQSATSASIA